MKLTKRRADRYCETCGAVAVVKRRPCQWCGKLLCVQCLAHTSRYCSPCRALLNLVRKKGT